MTETTFDLLPGTRIPMYPASSIFETTIAISEKGVLVGSEEVEAILARPPWSFEEADLRLTGERIAALQKEVDAVAKKTTARPARKTSRKGGKP